MLMILMLLPLTHAVRKKDYVRCCCADDNDGTTINPCSLEDADARILLHCLHAAYCGYTKVAIRTVDTDVVVLAISCFPSCVLMSFGFIVV